MLAPNRHCAPLSGFGRVQGKKFFRNQYAIPVAEKSVLDMPSIFSAARRLFRVIANSVRSFISRRAKLRKPFVPRFLSNLRSL